MDTGQLLDLFGKQEGAAGAASGQPGLQGAGGETAAAKTPAKATGG